MWIKWNFNSLLVGMQSSIDTLENWNFPIELYIQLYDPMTSLLGIYSGEMKMYAYTKTYKQLFIIALFILAKY